jgi:hypothetical protein
LPKNANGHHANPVATSAKGAVGTNIHNKLGNIRRFLSPNGELVTTTKQSGVLGPNGNIIKQPKLIKAEGDPVDEGQPQPQQQGKPKRKPGTGALLPVSDKLRRNVKAWMRKNGLYIDLTPDQIRAIQRAGGAPIVAQMANDPTKHKQTGTRHWWTVVAPKDKIEQVRETLKQLSPTVSTNYRGIEVNPDFPVLIDGAAVATDKKNTATYGNYVLGPDGTPIVSGSPEQRVFDNNGNLNRHSTHFNWDDLDYYWKNGRTPLTPEVIKEGKVPNLPKSKTIEESDTLGPENRKALKEFYINLRDKIPEQGHEQVIDQVNAGEALEDVLEGHAKHLIGQLDPDWHATKLLARDIAHELHTRTQKVLGWDKKPEIPKTEEHIKEMFPLRKEPITEEHLRDLDTIPGGVNNYFLAYANSKGYNPETADSEKLVPVSPLTIKTSHKDPSKLTELDATHSVEKYQGDDKHNLKVRRFDHSDLLSPDLRQKFYLFVDDVKIDERGGKERLKRVFPQRLDELPLRSGKKWSNILESKAQPNQRAAAKVFVRLIPKDPNNPYLPFEKPYWAWGVDDDTHVPGGGAINAVANLSTISHPGWTGFSNHQSPSFDQQQSQVDRITRRLSAGHGIIHPYGQAYTDRHYAKAGADEAVKHYGGHGYSGTIDMPGRSVNPIDIKLDPSLKDQPAMANGFDFEKAMMIALLRHSKHQLRITKLSPGAHRDSHFKLYRDLAEHFSMPASGGQRGTLITEKPKEPEYVPYTEEHHQQAMAEHEAVRPDISLEDTEYALNQARSENWDPEDIKNLEETHKQVLAHHEQGLELEKRWKESQKNGGKILLQGGSPQPSPDMSPEELEYISSLPMHFPGTIYLTKGIEHEGVKSNNLFGSVQESTGVSRGKSPTKKDTGGSVESRMSILDPLVADELGRLETNNTGESNDAYRIRQGNIREQTKYAEKLQSSVVEIQKQPKPAPVTAKPVERKPGESTIPKPTITPAPPTNNNGNGGGAVDPKNPTKKSEIWFRLDSAIEKLEKSRGKLG